MSQYLLAAEADKIQDLLFRSSQLREVVGGSQLLSRFCQDGAPLLLKKHGEVPDNDIIVADGGGFRILFPDKEKANKFGNELAELYRLTLGGSLTVAEPVECDLAQFQKANSSARDKLRQAKRESKGAIASVHLPYMAYCESCGVELAYERYQHEGRTQKNYICRSCLRKLTERERPSSEFLDRFQDTVRETAKEIDTSKRFELPLDNDKVAELDPRNYVAYLIADGNDMGVWFDKCQSEKQMRALSNSLTESLRFALAKPSRDLLAQARVRNKPNFLPVLPLILGGDDCFALIPAPWAIDFTRRFCLTYEEKMTPMIQELGGDKATISAAVVICKANYPYSHAHKRGEELLKDAKRLSKRIKMESNIDISAVSFDLITGNESIQPIQTSKESRYQSSLCPYLVSKKPLPDKVKKSGILINKLLEQRYKLSPIPSKRLAEIRELYDPATLELLDEPEEQENWNHNFKDLLSRIGRTPEHHKLIQDALSALGNANNEAPAHWLRLDRPSLNGSFRGNGMPDLISIWNYAYDLKKDIIKDYGV